MRKVRASGFVLCGVLIAACGDSLTPPTQFGQVSASEELVSQAMVDDAASMSERPDFRTDVANRDRVCDISDRTVVAGEGMAERAALLGRYLQANYARTASAHEAPAFTATAEELYAALQGRASCRTIVRKFIAMARAGRGVGGALHEEGLIREDDRLGELVRSARRQFVTLVELLRHDLRNQVIDRRVSDRPTSDRP